jgi:hypothetical protein
MLRVITIAVALVALCCAAEESDRKFVAPSPDHRYEVVFDQMATPPLIVREAGTDKTMMSMDEDPFCGRGAQVS